ncbi:MAG: Gfo/Idh/MocA family oxidoreductase [Verrucomicrobiae bacterium]|nr:Gfo/Idh/MocA family oxidoreductase [Verrucomicrobiae bacterium]
MLKTAFIGVGGISGVHLNHLKTRKDVKIAALCDMNEQNLDKRQKEFGGERYTDFRLMLDEVKPDAVWLCTPPLVRGGPLIECARRRIPVFCEKPVERDVVRARKIASTLARLKARVQIGYVFRTQAMVQLFKKASADDKIHVLQSFYGCGVSLNMALPAWFYEKEKSGGALVDQATHNLDLLRYLFGEVREILGAAENPVHKKKKGYTVDEALSMTLRFEDGAVGSHLHTWVGDAWRNEIMLSGEKRLYRLLLGKRRLVVEGPDAALKPIKKMFRGPRGPNGELVFEDKGNFYGYENDIFLDQVKSGKWGENPSDYADGLKSLELTVACDKAVTKGRAVL